MMCFCCFWNSCPVILAEVTFLLLSYLSLGFMKHYLHTASQCSKKLGNYLCNNYSKAYDNCYHPSLRKNPFPSL